MWEQQEKYNATRRAAIEAAEKKKKEKEHLKLKAQKEKLEQDEKDAHQVHEEICEQITRDLAAFRTELDEREDKNGRERSTMALRSQI